MRVVETMADLSIRRACGFAALGVASIMVALSYDLVLAFRTGAALIALACLALGLAAWRAPHRDLRHSELWALLNDGEDALVRRLPRAKAQSLLASVLRARLLWHAERLGLAAIALWVLALVLAFLGPVQPG